MSSRPFKPHTRKRRSGYSATRSIADFPSTSWRPPFKDAVAITAQFRATTWNMLKSIEQIIRARGTADIIVPHFVEIRNRPFRRTVISKLYTRLVNLASGYRLAYYNGNPLYLRSHVMRFHVECSGFGYQAEFLTRLISEGATFKEIPLIAYDREGSTAMSVRNLLSVTHSLITIALRRLRIVLFE